MTQTEGNSHHTLLLISERFSHGAVGVEVNTSTNSGEMTRYSLQSCRRGVFPWLLMNRRGKWGGGLLLLVKRRQMLEETRVKCYCTGGFTSRLQFMDRSPTTLTFSMSGNPPALCQSFMSSASVSESVFQSFPGDNCSMTFIWSSQRWRTPAEVVLAYCYQQVRLEITEKFSLTYLNHLLTLPRKCTWISAGILLNKAAE